MLTKADILAIGKVMDERIDARFSVFESKLDAHLDARFTAFEARIDSKIEALAIMTKNGFDRIQAELNEFKEEMYEFKRKTEQSFYEIDGRLNAIDARLTRLETNGESSNHKIDSLVSLYRNHDGRLVKLERSVFPAGA